MIGTAPCLEHLNFGLNPANLSENLFVFLLYYVVGFYIWQENLIKLSRLDKNWEVSFSVVIITYYLIFTFGIMSAPTNRLRNYFAQLLQCKSKLMLEWPIISLHVYNQNKKSYMGESDTTCCCHDWNTGWSMIQID